MKLKWNDNIEWTMVMNAETKVGIRPEEDSEKIKTSPDLRVRRALSGSEEHTDWRDLMFERENLVSIKYVESLRKKGIYQVMQQGS